MEIRLIIPILMFAVGLFSSGSSSFSAGAESDSTIPEVLLSNGHQELCLVGVGEPMPDFAFLKRDGDSVKLSSLFGDMATVVVFWRDDNAMTRTLLGDLSREVVQRYGAGGVAVIAIAVAQPDSIAPQVGDETAQYIELLDRGGAAFASVGSKMLPRVYVLDRAGNIKWFDIEYSRATRRELRQTLDAITNNSSHH